jgi:integral membrane sensor domain MASE1
VAFTCVIVLLMWSAVRLPRMEAFLVFLVTVMVVSLMIAQSSGADHPARRADAERPLAAVPDAAPAR